ncbi:MAG TPA: hypothetical protein VHZ07_28600 [Bryobacteraceae bacterium]|nr:hypothetical protein [Bryobacteraceae bacterium]
MLRVLARESLWLGPFLCIGVLSLGLFRALPHFPVPAHIRTVVDISGTPVRIALPFRGIVLAPNSFPATYLEDTRSPDLLLYAGNTDLRKWFAKGVMSWVYPQILSNKLWNDKLFRATSSPFTEIESLIAYDASVYAGCGGPPDLVRRVGLPVFNCGGSPAKMRRVPILMKGVGCGSAPNLRWAYYPEIYLFPTLRTYSALIGHAELAEPRIEAYCQVIDDLREELQPSTLTYRPRVLARAEEKGTLARAGLVDAEQRRYNPNDPEQLLAMDPDMIFLPQGSPREFDQDIRWQGLKAVRNRRVYRRPGLIEWWTAGVTFKPIETRWMAEVAHPDRLQPKVRQLLRDRMFAAFGYRLSDEQIDLQLHVAENSGAVGTERFTRNYQGAERPGPSK